jgi:hypothetical protein
MLSKINCYYQLQNKKYKHEYQHNIVPEKEIHMVKVLSGCALSDMSYLMLWDSAALTSNKGKTEVEAKPKEKYRGKEAERQIWREVRHRDRKRNKEASTEI